VTHAEVISVVALVVSITSVAFSLYFNYRDRACLRTTSKFYSGRSHPYIEVTIVNAGRRPIILRMWGGSDEKGEWVGQFLGEEKRGLRIGEHERHDLSLDKNDLLSETPDGQVLFNDLWVEDSLGRRHPIKDAKANVKLLWDT
jgi:hypothetical protein